MAHCDTFSSTK